MVNDQTRAFFDFANNKHLKLTYEDVLLAPNFASIDPSMTDVSTRATRNVRLKIPIWSAAMDTLTEAAMAIAMATGGGCGVIHRGSSARWQAEQVARVKLRMSGFIETPKTVLASSTIEDLLKRQAERERAGKNIFHTFPVLDQGKVVGLVTERDLKFHMREKTKTIGEVMTRFDQLVVTKPGISTEQAYQTLHDHRKSVLMTVDDNRHLAGMYLYSDLQRLFEEDSAGFNIDSGGKLIVAGAIGTGAEALERAELLIKKGCDIIVVDSAHGDSKAVIDTVKFCKKLGPADVVGGNVATADGAKRLAEVGADAIKVGIGPGSICTTREVTGFGVPQLSAVHDVVRAMEEFDIPVIADGGIVSSGDMVKALAAGAESCMLGSMLAGTDECPGKRRILNGREVVEFRGMGSPSAIFERNGMDRYNQSSMPRTHIAPQGVDAVVSYKGPVGRILGSQVGGIKSGLGYAGARTIRELQHNARFIRQTSNGVRESHVHHVSVVDGG